MVRIFTCLVLAAIVAAFVGAHFVEQYQAPVTGAAIAIAGVVLAIVAVLLGAWWDAAVDRRTARRRRSSL